MKKIKKKKKEEASPLTKGAGSILPKGKAKKKPSSKGAAKASSLTKGGNTGQIFAKRICSCKEAMGQITSDQP